MQSYRFFDVAANIENKQKAKSTKIKAFFECIVQKAFGFKPQRVQFNLSLNLCRCSRFQMYQVCSPVPVVHLYQVITFSCMQEYSKCSGIQLSKIGTLEKNNSGVAESSK
jgi:hypothetical protein